MEVPLLATQLDLLPFPVVEGSAAAFYVRIYSVLAGLSNLSRASFVPSLCLVHRLLVHEIIDSVDGMPVHLRQSSNVEDWLCHKPFDILYHRIVAAATNITSLSLGVGYDANSSSSSSPSTSGGGKPFLQVIVDPRRQWSVVTPDDLRHLAMSLPDLQALGCNIVFCVVDQGDLQARERLVVGAGERWLRQLCGRQSWFPFPVERASTADFARREKSRGNFSMKLAMFRILSSTPQQQQQSDAPCRPTIVHVEPDTDGLPTMIPYQSIVPGKVSFLSARRTFFSVLSRRAQCLVFEQVPGTKPDTDLSRFVHSHALVADPEDLVLSSNHSTFYAVPRAFLPVHAMVRLCRIMLVPDPNVLVGNAAGQRISVIGVRPSMSISEEDDWAEWTAVADFFRQRASRNSNIADTVPAPPDADAVLDDWGQCLLYLADGSPVGRREVAYHVCLSEILGERVPLENVILPDRPSPLLIALQCRNYAAVQLLLTDLHADPCSPLYLGSTPLSHAVSCQDVEAVEMLLHHLSGRFDSAALEAASVADASLFDRLMAAFSLSAPPPPLSLNFAVSCGAPRALLSDLVRLRGFSAAVAHPVDGFLPLHVACCMSNPSLVSFLVSDLSADVSFHPPAGSLESYVMCAVDEGSLPTLDALMQLGCKPSSEDLSYAIEEYVYLSLFYESRSADICHVMFAIVQRLVHALNEQQQQQQQVSSSSVFSSAEEILAKYGLFQLLSSGPMTATSPRLLVSAAVNQNLNSWVVAQLRLAQATRSESFTEETLLDILQAAFVSGNGELAQCLLLDFSALISRRRLVERCLMPAVERGDEQLLQQLVVPPPKVAAAAAAGDNASPLRSTSAAGTFDVHVFRGAISLAIQRNLFNVSRVLVSSFGCPPMEHAELAVFRLPSDANLQSAVDESSEMLLSTLLSGSSSSSSIDGNGTALLDRCFWATTPLAASILANSSSALALVLSKVRGSGNSQPSLPLEFLLYGPLDVIQLCAALGRFKVLEVLLRSIPYLYENAFRRLGSGLAPLELAIRHSYPAVVRLLLDDPLHRLSEPQVSQLLTIAETTQPRSEEIIRLLLAEGPLEGKMEKVGGFMGSQNQRRLFRVSMFEAKMDWFKTRSEYYDGEAPLNSLEFSELEAVIFEKTRLSLDLRHARKQYQLRGEMTVEVFGRLKTLRRRNPTVFPYRIEELLPSSSDGAASSAD